MLFSGLFGSYNDDDGRSSYNWYPSSVTSTDAPSTVLNDEEVEDETRYGHYHGPRDDNTMGTTPGRGVAGWKRSVMEDATAEEESTCYYTVATATTRGSRSKARTRTRRSSSSRRGGRSRSRRVKSVASPTPTSTTRRTAMTRDNTETKRMSVVAKTPPTSRYDYYDDSGTRTVYTTSAATTKSSASTTNHNSFSAAASSSSVSRGGSTSRRTNYTSATRVHMTSATAMRGDKKATTGSGGGRGGGRRSSSSSWGGVGNGVTSYSSPRTGGVGAAATSSGMTTLVPDEREEDGYTVATRGTKYTTATRGTKYTTATRGTKFTTATRGTKYTTATRGTKYTNATQGTNYTTDTRGTTVFSTGGTAYTSYDQRDDAESYDEGTFNSFTSDYESHNQARKEMTTTADGGRCRRDVKAVEGGNKFMDPWCFACMYPIESGVTTGGGCLGDINGHDDDDDDDDVKTEEASMKATITVGGDDDWAEYMKSQTTMLAYAHVPTIVTVPMPSSSPSAIIRRQISNSAQLLCKCGGAMCAKGSSLWNTTWRTTKHSLAKKSRSLLNEVQKISHKISCPPEGTRMEFLMQSSSGVRNDNNNNNNHAISIVNKSDDKIKRPSNATRFSAC